LDNFGLCAALRWQLKKTWANSNVISTEAYPAVEPRFESHAAITLFRVAQGALSIALKRASVKSTDLTVRIDKGNFSMRFSDDGTFNAAEQTDDAAMILASMRHRIRAVGGLVHLARTEAGATVLTTSMPFSDSFIAPRD
jgi:two-component system, NarL family, sensor histidine kinase UhpB